MRDLGEIEWLQGILPEWAIPLFVLITHTASIGAFALICAGIYWFGERKRGAYVLGVVLGALAITFGLKALFGLPRPPVAVQMVGTETAAFPSGHALGATVVFGILAITLEEYRTWPFRATVAAVLVGLVSLSRLVLGVHYLVDVVAGIAIGLGYLAIVTRWREPLVMLVVAVGLAALGVVFGATWGTGAIACLGPVCLVPETVLVLGAALGALGGWVAVDVPTEPWGPRDRTAVLGMAGLAPLALVVAYSAFVDALLGVAFFGSGILVAGFVALPAVLE